MLNVGTPAAPTAKGLREFYRYFFSDPFLFDINPLGRWLLRNLIILPFRAPKTARQYATIWMDEGSPLKVYTDRLQKAMQTAFDEGAAESASGKVHIRIGMSHSKPFIRDTMAELEQLGCQEILLLPLFPQYSTATTAAVFHEVRQSAKAWRTPPTLNFINDLYAEPPFIQAWATLINNHLKSDDHHLIFSYHGLPESTILKADGNGHCAFNDCCDKITEANTLCYRAQCFATTRSIVKSLNRPALQHSIAFQSRFGRQAWIQPYLDEHLSALLKKGIRKVAVATPSFVSDCLETTHEIGIEYREQFINEGGESFTLIPNLNAEPHWHKALTQIALNSCAPKSSGAPAGAPK